MTVDQRGADVRNEPEAPLAVTLPSSVGSSAQARQLVSEALDAWGFSEDAVDDAALIVTELVSNAVDHASGPLELRLVRTPAGVRIEVADRSPAPPRQRPVDVTSARGRGLVIVDSIAKAWGTEPTGHGKVVWAELA